MPTLDSIRDPQLTRRRQRFGRFLVLLFPLALVPMTGCGGPSDADVAAAEPQEQRELSPGGPTPNGLELPDGFENWAVLGAANRLDNGTIRVITGNSTAVQAARAGQTNPWPDGSQIADVVWADGRNPDWTDVVSPGSFSALALMEKDADAFADDAGWRYGIWSGHDLVAPAETDFDRGCVACHVENAASNDSVFTRVMPLPALDVVAEPAPNGVEAPSGWQDWAVIGVADRTDNGTIRVITGNAIAVEAARDGTRPWPEGSAIADLVWPDNTNPDWADMNGPGEFGTLAYMIKDSALYPDAGGWGYGLWTGPDLTPGEPGFDDACIQCHLEGAPENDYVFTRTDELPSTALPAR